MTITRHLPPVRIDYTKHGRTETIYTETPELARRIIRLMYANPHIKGARWSRLMPS